jgi:hypothetical protein
MDPTTDKSTPPEPDHGRTFSLATILLLTTVVAIFMAAARGYEVRPKPDQQPSAGLLSPVFRAPQPRLDELEDHRAGMGALLGLIVGVVIALRRRRWALGLLLAVVPGLWVGAAAAVPLAEPCNFPVALAGSAVLLTLAAVVRAFSRDSR